VKKLYKSFIKLVFVLLLPIASISLLIYIIVFPSEVSTLQTVAVTMMTTILIFIAVAVWNISSNVNMLPHITYQAVPIITIGIGLHPVTRSSLLIFLPLVTIEIGAKRRKYLSEEEAKSMFSI
jgi:hypothetical protein|tara:strand:+ start:4236 stop:4604 length:369 start_codon:yes stop_codon:yes gene_type:complete